MAAFTVSQPLWAAESGGSTGPRIQQMLPIPVTAAFRAGDLVILDTEGTITNPTTKGALATVAGPTLGTNTAFNIVTSSTSITQGALTVTATTSGASGAPALQYFGVVVYSNTGDTSESLASQPFLVNVASGLLPVFSVTATGAPSGGDHFRVYLSNTPNTFYLQGSTTANGSTVTPAYPLANRQGINKAAAAQSTGILGMADSDSDQVYFGGVGPGFGNRSILGPTQSVPPGWDSYALEVPIIKLQQGLVVMNLVQAWSNSLLYASVGFNIDANTGYFVADTTQTAAGVIQQKPFGPTLGDVGDTYARVYVKLNGSAVS